MTTATIQAWGNSAGIRIPKTILDDAKAFIGKEMEIYVEGEQLVLKPRQLTLKERCALMTPETMHEEMFSVPMGREWI